LIEFVDMSEPCSFRKSRPCPNQSSEYAASAEAAAYIAQMLMDLALQFEAVRAKAAIGASCRFLPARLFLCSA
jgi:hypothetical protein